MSYNTGMLMPQPDDEAAAAVEEAERIFAQVRANARYQKQLDWLARNAQKRGPLFKDRRPAPELPIRLINFFAACTVVAFAETIVEFNMVPVNILLPIAVGWLGAAISPIRLKR